jgi:hypothetical protein
MFKRNRTNLQKKSHKSSKEIAQISRGFCKQLLRTKGKFMAVAPNMATMPLVEGFSPHTNSS